MVSADGSMCFSDGCVLRRIREFLTGAGIGAIQPVPITGALPAYGTPFIQERCSVAPAAQTRLSTERERERMNLFIHTWEDW